MPVLLEKLRADGVLEFRLNRPDKRNALNQELVELLTDAFARASVSDDVRAVVLAAEGKVFSAGADLESLRAMQTATREDNERDSRLLSAMFDAILSNSKPVIARVHGHAIAGGCGLVAACDFAVGATGARLGFTEVGIGFVPAIVTVIAAAKLRGSDVRRLTLTGSLISAKEAERIGLLSRTVDAEDLDPAVDELVDTMAGVSSQAVSLTKQLLVRIYGRPFSQALDEGAEVNVLARESDDCREGVAAFLEKRQPAWKPNTGRP